MITTPWGEALKKDCPLGEYPRPQFKRDSYISLNGIWKCDFCESEEIPDSFSQTIVVPFSPEAPLSGVNRTLSDEEYLIYERNCEIARHFGLEEERAKIVPLQLTQFAKTRLYKSLKQKGRC